MERRHRQKTDILDRLDAMMEEAWRLTVELRDLEMELERRLAIVRAEYEAGIQARKELIEALDKEIQHTAKRYDQEIFDCTQDESWVRLRHGTLIRSIERRVKKARGVLERLEKLGRLDAVKIAKSVDWARLEAFTDEELAMVGTERIERVRYGYDLAVREREGAP